MSSYAQSDRPLMVTSAVGNDTLLVAGFRGHEAISQLFRFEVDLIADLTDKIRFDQLVGSTMTIEMRLPAEDKRWFNGLVTRFTQGGRDEKFIRYHAELAPKLWRLTKKIRSRIFQQLSTPDILRAVFTGLDVSYQILGAYYPRVYCVQYRESDFDFASRLMEEEGIYYFFVHTSSGHQMIVTDVATAGAAGVANPAGELARAANLTGGSLAPPRFPPVPPDPFAPARSAATAIKLSCAQAEPLRIVDTQRLYLELGIGIAEGRYL